MAKVQAQVIGGDIKQITADTVAEVKTKMGAAGYTASVNGEPQDDGYELADYEFVSLAPAVKGGC
jgi:hypothetical protein